MQKQPIAIGDHIEVPIMRLGINGEGIGYHQRLTIFIEGALPEETIEAEIIGVTKTFAQAKIIKIIKESPHRRVPFCPYYEACGGCQLQHLEMDQMLIYKRDLIVQAIKRYVKIPIDERIIEPMIASHETTHYRNKASLPLRYVKHKNRFGMYKKASNIFLPIDDCPVQDVKINQLLRALTKQMDAFKIQAYDPKTKSGHLSTAIVRMDDQSQAAQAALLITKPHPKLTAMIHAWVKAQPMIKSVETYLDDPRKKTSFFEGEHTHVFGSEHLPVKLGGHSFLLRPEAFFQLNYQQADQFYQTMQRLADVKPTDVIIDAYSGVAPVSLYLHQSIKKAYAIEIDKDANASAKKSIEAQGIKNIELLQGDFFKVLKGLKKIKVDVMFFDPPRTGLGKETIEVILKMLPKKIIYGSCNPSTLAKDLDQLMTSYDLKHIVPLDMFPYTAHVENVTLLTLKTP